MQKHISRLKEHRSHYTDDAQLRIEEKLLEEEKSPVGRDQAAGGAVDERHTGTDAEDHPV